MKRRVRAAVAAAWVAMLLTLWQRHAHGADSVAPVTVVLHVPYPITGPREIQASDRASRSYRAVAARTAPPITDTMAAMVDAALLTGANIRAMRSRRDNPTALAIQHPVGDGHSDAVADLILAGDDIVRTSIAVGPADKTPFGASVIEPLADMPYVLVCNSPQCRAIAGLDAPQRRLRSLDFARIGTTGDFSGSRLVADEWNRRTGSRALRVPYAGGNGVVSDLVAGRIDAAFLALPLALRHLGNKKLIALGITAERRFETLLHVPTFTEAGTPIVFAGWFAVFGSKHLSSDLAARAQAAIRAYRTEDSARTELQISGLVPGAATPVEIERRIDADQRHRRAAIQ